MIKNICLLIFFQIIFQFSGFGQYYFRTAIHEDLIKHRYGECIERLDKNSDRIKSYRLLSFNEFWMIHLMCDKPVSLKDFELLKSLKPVKTLYNDTLANSLYSYGALNKSLLNHKLDSLHTINYEKYIDNLYLNMLMAVTPEEIKNFKEQKNKILKEIVNNETEYPDSIYNIFKGMNIKRINYDFSMVSKILINKATKDWFIDDGLERINSMVGLVFTKNRRTGNLSNEFSLDLNIIDRYEKNNSSNNFGYGYSNTPETKIRIGWTYSLGMNIYTNRNLSMSLLGFLSSTSFNTQKSIPTYGLNFNSTFFILKAKEKININGIRSIQRHIKVSVGYDFYNESFILGLGTGISTIWQLKQIRF